MVRFSRLVEHGSTSWILSSLAALLRAVIVAVLVLFALPSQSLAREGALPHHLNLPTIGMSLRYPDGWSEAPKQYVNMDELIGYPLKPGQLTYDCRYSTMHGMPVTGGHGFRGLKPLWYNGVPP
jgi:hypothetical protein